VRKKRNHGVPIMGIKVTKKKDWSARVGSGGLEILGVSKDCEDEGTSKKGAEGKTKWRHGVCERKRVKLQGERGEKSKGR